MIGGNTRAAKSFTKLFASNSRNIRKDRNPNEESELDMLERIIAESNIIYDRVYQKNRASARVVGERDYNADDDILGSVDDEADISESVQMKCEDVIMDGLKLDAANQTNSMSGGADIGEMIENVLEGGGLGVNGITKKNSSSSSDSSDDEEGTTPMITPDGIVDIVSEENAMEGGCGTDNTETDSVNMTPVENILVEEENADGHWSGDEKDDEIDLVIDILEKGNPIDDILEKSSGVEIEKNPVEDILEKSPENVSTDNDEKNPVEDILEKSNPIEDILEKSSKVNVETNPVEDILEKTNPIDDILEKSSTDIPTDNAPTKHTHRPFLAGTDDEFYSEYSDESDVEMVDVTPNKYLELLQAIRRTNDKLAAKSNANLTGGSKKSPARGNVKVIDMFPWIVDDSDDE